MGHVRALRDQGGGGLLDVGNAAAVLVVAVLLLAIAITSQLKSVNL